MLQSIKKQVIFANPMTLIPNMETITLSYEPGSDFAVALDELIRNSEGVRVVKRKKTSKLQKTNCALDVALQEEKEGKVQTFENIDVLFKTLGI